MNIVKRFFPEKKKSAKPKHRSTHHIIPTSRDGPRARWNEYHWTTKKHRAWHSLFHNYLPSTCISVIRDWTGNNGRLIISRIGKKYLKDWKCLFGDWSPQEAIEYIEKTFLPVEIRFLGKSKN